MDERGVKHTAMVFFDGPASSESENLRFPSLPSPLTAPWVGIVARRDDSEVGGGGRIARKMLGTDLLRPG